MISGVRASIFGSLPISVLVGNQRPRDVYSQLLGAGRFGRQGPRWSHRNGKFPLGVSQVQDDPMMLHVGAGYERRVQFPRNYHSMWTDKC